MSELYLLIDGEQKGPYSEQQIRSMYNSATINATTYFWQEGQAEWLPVDKLFSSQSSAETENVVPRIASNQSSAQPLQHAPPIEHSSIKTETSGLAIASLIFAIIGFFPLAIILGHCAKNSVKKNSSLTGSGLAVAGLILGYTELATVAVIVFLFFGALFTMGRQTVSPVFTSKHQQSTEQQPKPKEEVLVEWDKADGILSVPWGTSRDSVRQLLASKGYALDNDQTIASLGSNETGIRYVNGSIGGIKSDRLTIVFSDDKMTSTQTEYTISAPAFQKLGIVLKNRFGASSDFPATTQWDTPNGSHAVFDYIQPANSNGKYSCYLWLRK